MRQEGRVTALEKRARRLPVRAAGVVVEYDAGVPDVYYWPGKDGATEAITLAEAERRIGDGTLFLLPRNGRTAHRGD